MKKISIFLTFFMLFSAGCSYKNEAIELKPYTYDYKGDLTKNKKSVFIRSIKDTRDSKIVGYVLQDDRRGTVLYSEVDFAERFKKDMPQALHLAGFEKAYDDNSADLSLDVTIKKIEIIYNDDKSTGKNLEGEMEVDVIIHKNMETITQNFRQKGGLWLAPSYTSKDIEPFLYTLFSDSINDIVSKLTRH
ncbi:MAG: YajG family lipoprotein [Sulfurospirillaceae bacterium]|nr:YajG family lipoprotein [Sulfurospirillaceae bacterium]